MGLFRQEAVEATSNRLGGELLLLPRFNHYLLSALLLAWLALLVAFLIQAKFSRKESAPGFLEPPNGLVRIYPPAEGRVVQLTVAEGDTVSAGQVLATINAEKVLADGQPLQASLMKEYDKQSAVLQRQMNRLDGLQLIEQNEIMTRLSAARNRLFWLNQQRDSLQKRLQLEQRRLARYEQLNARGHVTDADADQIRSLVMAAEQELLVLGGLRAEAEQQLQELKLKLEGLAMRRQNQSDDLQLRMSDLNQAATRLRGHGGYRITAPRDGVISNLQIREGQRAIRNLPLMSIMPADTELKATLLVPVRAAGLLKNGQRVLLRYDAFPYETYGFHEGHIESIARTALLPGEHPPYPFSIREAVYRVTVDAEEASFSAQGVQRRPGMTLRADIELEQRPLLHWLFDPLYRLRARMQ